MSVRPWYDYADERYHTLISAAAQVASNRTREGANWNTEFRSALAAMGLRLASPGVSERPRPITAPIPHPDFVDGWGEDSVIVWSDDPEHGEPPTDGPIPEPEYDAEAVRIASDGILKKVYPPAVMVPNDEESHD